jgi:voltage-gated potassium channel
MAALFRHRFKLLLGTLLMLILAMPVVLEALAETAPAAARATTIFGGLCLMIAAVLVVSGSHGMRTFALCLLAPSVLIEAAALFLWPGNLLLVHLALRSAFVVFIIGAMLRDLFSPATITFDTVCSSLCVYLLIGIAWENVYAILEITSPATIMSTIRTPADQPQIGVDPDLARILRMRYFSFATLTSVGYGDIVPGTTVARMCAVTEALMGQIYLLVMVSRLVGLQVSQTMPAPTDKSNDKS